jgi:hypothetical protein
LPWDSWFRVWLTSEDPAALAAAEEPRIDGASGQKQILSFTDDLSRTFCGVTFSAVMESPARAFAEQDFPERPEVFSRARMPGGLFWTGSSKEASAMVWKHATPLPSRYDPPAHTLWATYKLGRPIRIDISYWARLRELCIFVHGPGIAGPAALRVLIARPDSPAPKYLVLFLRPGLREYDRSEERPTLAYVAVSEITLSYGRPR